MKVVKMKTYRALIKTSILSTMAAALLLFGHVPSAAAFFGDDEGSQDTIEDVAKEIERLQEKLEDLRKEEESKPVYPPGVPNPLPEDTACIVSPLYGYNPDTKKYEIIGKACLPYGYGKLIPVPSIPGCYESNVVKDGKVTPVTFCPYGVDLGDDHTGPGAYITDPDPKLDPGVITQPVRR